MIILFLYCFCICNNNILDDISSHTNSMVNLNKMCGNRSCKSIYKCKPKICKLKSNFVSRDIA